MFTQNHASNLSDTPAADSHTADFSGGVSFDRFDLGIFVKNAFDTDTVIQHPQVASIVQGYRVPPRSIGMSLAARF
jgi:outer membrane receptor protein involved in Fe transport